ncbi:MAG: hypothetical protein JEZ02_02860 [Desulfatibacillum sp.]|nr:hypothetical protein [Desulfatibacillum sp.]
MKKHPIVLTFAALIAVLLLAAPGAFAMGPRPTWPEQHTIDYDHVMRDGLGGWNIMQDDYRAFNLLDGLSLEWDYYSFHDNDGKFTGVVGIVVADPEGKLGGSETFSALNLMPSGVNFAFYGKFADGEPFATYIPTGLGHEVGVDERSVFATGDNGTFIQEIPVRGTNGEPDSIILRGNSGDYSWDLTVKQGFTDYAPLKPETWLVGNDTNTLLADEHWTVNMLWPTTEVQGAITNLATGEVVTIDGHGYRENSFGRWAFVMGGWDFAFMSDPETHVQWAFQTYHFDTEDLDYVDVDFLDNGNPVVQRFHVKDGELGWTHGDWQWDEAARQYTPTDLTVIGKNDQYTVEAYVNIGTNYAPMLSDVTFIVNTYCIFAQMPWISGTVKRTATGEVVATFDGQGGGEFSVMRSFCANEPNLDLKKHIFTQTFSNPMPE